MVLSDFEGRSEKSSDGRFTGCMDPSAACGALFTRGHDRLFPPTERRVRQLTDSCPGPPQAVSPYLKGIAPTQCFPNVGFSWTWSSQGP